MLNGDRLGMNHQSSSQESSPSTTDDLFRVKKRPTTLEESALCDDLSEEDADAITSKGEDGYHTHEATNQQKRQRRDVLEQILAERSSRGFYRVKQLREIQKSQGMEQSQFNPCQMGLEEPQTFHHVSINYTLKGGEPSYRVRVCKSCGKEEPLVELGTYVDRESAVLINDCHEIMMNRNNKLHCLVPSDRPFFDQLSALRFNKGKLEETPVLTIITERLQMHAEKVKRKVVSDTAHLGMLSASQTSSGHFLQANQPYPLHAAFSAFQSFPLTVHPQSPILSRSGQATHLIANCSTSYSSLLAQFGIAVTPAAGQEILYKLTFQLLSQSHDERRLSTLPTLPLALMRCIICSYAPLTDPVALHAMMKPLEDEILSRKQTSPIVPGLMRMAQNLRNSYSKTAAIRLLKTILRCSLDSVCYSWRYMHETKFPRYNYPNYTTSDVFTRQMFLRGAAQSGREHTQALGDVLDYICTFILRPGIVDDASDLLALIGSIRLLISLIVWVTFAIRMILYIYVNDGQILNDAVEDVAILEQFILCLPQRVQFIYRCKQLDVLLLLYAQGTPTQERVDRVEDVTRVSSALTMVLDAIHLMPNYRDASHQPSVGYNSLYPVIIDPLVPGAICMHEYGLLLLSYGCRTLLTVPDAFYHSTPRTYTEMGMERGFEELTREYRSILNFIHKTLTVLLEWMRQTGCGLMGISTFHAIFQLHQVLLRHRQKLCWPDTAGITWEIMVMIRQLLHLLATKFVLGQDLLQMLGAQPGISSSALPEAGTLQDLEHPLLCMSDGEQLSYHL